MELANYYYMNSTFYKECRGNKLWRNFGDSFWFKTNLDRIEDCSTAGKLPLHWLLARYTKTLLVIILFTGQLLITLSFTINRPVSGVWKWGGARFWSCESHEMKSACAAEIFTKMGVKSTLFVLQKSYKHKSLCTINFLKNETRKNVLIPQNGGRADVPPQTRAL